MGYEVNLHAHKDGIPEIIWAPRLPQIDTRTRPSGDVVQDWGGLYLETRLSMALSLSRLAPSGRPSVPITSIECDIGYRSES
jgi:hypothetical protein